MKNRISKFFNKSKLRQHGDRTMAQDLAEARAKYDEFTVTFRPSHLVNECMVTVSTNDQTTITIHGQAGEDIYSTLIHMILDAR